MDASLIKAFVAAATRFVLPPRCLVCGAAGAGNRELCDPCKRMLARNVACCGRCAIPLPAAIPECEECVATPRPWADLWVPFVYGWPLDSLEARFKFAGSLAAGRVLADCWLDTGSPPSFPELIIPVPLHRSRLRKRGYNQALELARPLGRRLGIPVRHDVLRRARVTGAQTDLDAAGRASNVRGAFAVDRPTRARHVALLDDVMTTGATLSEAATTLVASGITRVDIWALARTPRRKADR